MVLAQFFRNRLESSVAAGATIAAKSTVGRGNRGVMKKNAVLLILIIFPLIGLLRDARAGNNHNFLVLYSNDVHCETEPCG